MPRRPLAVVVPLSLVIVVLATGAPPSSAHPRPPAADPVAVAALARDVGIPVDQAARHLARQPAVQQLRATARRQFPATFAGVWVDHARNGRIRLAFTRDARRSAATLLGGFAHRRLVDVATLRYSTADIERLHARLSLDRPALARAGVDVVSIGVDDARQRVVVRVAGAASAARRAIASRHGGAAPVRVEALARTAVTHTSDCANRRSCRSPMRGGLQIGRRLADGRWHVCSTGFSAYAATNRAVDYLLTAGHCGAVDTAWFHDNKRLGLLKQRFDGGSVDAAKILLPDWGSWRTSRLVYATDAAEHHPMRRRGEPAELGTDDVVCKVGWVTGRTCGRVLHRFDSPTIDGRRYTNLLAVRACVKKGDSGGAVYQDSTAYAMVMGTYDPWPREDCGRYDAFYASHLVNIESALNVKIRLD